MNAASDASACLSTSRRSFEMSAVTSSTRPEIAIVSAAIVAAISTSTMRQLTVELTIMLMLSALVAWIFSRSSVWILSVMNFWRAARSGDERACECGGAPSRAHRPREFSNERARAILPRARARARARAPHTSSSCG